MYNKRILLTVLLLLIISILSFSKIIQTEFYQQLLKHPDFKPCKPIGCNIDIQNTNTPVCFEGKCRPCTRDGQCILAYRVYLDQLYSKAKCNKIYGSCSKQ